jgi:hypothetical protein
MGLSLEKRGREGDPRIFAASSTPSEDISSSLPFHLSSNINNIHSSLEGEAESYREEEVDLLLIEALRPLLVRLPRPTLLVPVCGPEDTPLVSWRRCLTRCGALSHIRQGSIRRAMGIGDGMVDAGWSTSHPDADGRVWALCTLPEGKWTAECEEHSKAASC